MGEVKIPTIDLVIILVYLFGILLVGILAVIREKMTSTNYFLAGRSLTWPLIGAALFASNISTIHLVGLAGSGFKDGLVWGNFEWMAAFVLIILGLVFAPFYFKNKVSTLPEFIENRYGADSRAFVAFMAILGALFIHIGVSLYAGAVVFEKFFGINKYFSIILISLFTGIYTVLGGLKAVVVTETIQTVILIIGAATMTFFAIDALPEHGITTWNGFMNATKEGQMSMLHTSSDSPLPWYAVMLGYPVLGIWYWCADQTIVQRVLGARSLADAQKGPVFAGFIKILPVFFMVLPGVLGYVLFGDNIKKPDETLPVMILELLPVGMRGLMAAALMAALMSTIAAALNSSGTLVVVDILEKIRPETSDKFKVRTGRITAVLVMILAILWSPLVGKFEGIFEAINQLLSVLSPPIAAVFVLGVLWRRGNRYGSFYTLVTGFILGIIVFLIDFPIIGDVKIITEEWNTPFMLQAFYLFLVCCGIFVTVSLNTAKPDMDRIRTYTLESPLAFITEGKVKGIGDPRILSAILLGLMIILYYIFR